jgi:hypothetical protein
MAQQSSLSWPASTFVRLLLVNVASLPNDPTVRGGVACRLKSNAAFVSTLFLRGFLVSNTTTPANLTVDLSSGSRAARAGADCRR